MGDRKWQVMVIPHTHWDREWYLPYQSFRARLVALIDRVLELFERSPAFPYFLLDGQTIVLEDYLEVRPDRRQDLARVIAEGRLLVGPWFIIPDEFLVGGEALVRNFLRGIRLGRSFGGAMMVGYIPDPFGHAAHMPAVLAGFGIKDAVIWRGADQSLEKTEFLWRSPDGSEVLTIHLPQGYGNGVALPLEREALLRRLEAALAEPKRRATTPVLLLMNGTDHWSPQPELPLIIAAANESVADAEFRHATLPMAVRAVREHLGAALSDLPVHEGEFRSGQRAHLLPGVASARMWIKQRNQRCEDLLTAWAEPFSVWASVLAQRMGSEWRQPLPVYLGHMPFPSDEASIAGLLRQAWRYLLENQPHDSICGCSTDQVHQEMRTRFDWCETIGEEVTRQSLRTIAQLAAPAREAVVVFNPAGGPRTDFASTLVPWRDGRAPTALVDHEGRRMPCQPLAGVVRNPLPEDTGQDLVATRIEVGFVARDVPAHGYRVYDLEYREVAAAGEPLADDAIENEFFAVAADRTDGTLTVRDRLSGRVWQGLNRFVDEGDRGDEYNFCKPEQDTVIDRPAAPPVIRVLEQGPVRCRLEVALTYRVPAKLAPERDRRSDDTVECPIRTVVTLVAGVPRIDIATTIDNRAADHRLRAAFPSDVRTPFTSAEQHFGVVRRAIALPEHDESWAEEPIGTHPAKRFVDVSDGDRGLMIANRGLPEYEAIEGPDGVILMLTLLRCVGFLSRSDIHSRPGDAGPSLPTPGAQEIGVHTLEYSIIPHNGDWSVAWQQAHWFGLPMRARWSGPGSGVLPPAASLIDGGPSFVVSALKRAENGDGVVARLYNIRDSEQEAAVRFGLRHAGVQVVDLKEEPLPDRAAAGADGVVPIRLRRNQIVTLKFVDVR